MPAGPRGGRLNGMEQHTDIPAGTTPAGTTPTGTGTATSGTGTPTTHFTLRRSRTSSFPDAAATAFFAENVT